MNVSDAEKPDHELYCAACRIHFDEDVEVRGSPKAGGFFACPRSGHPTHYGPWEYAVDKDGVEYEYDAEGNIVESLSPFRRKLFRLRNRITERIKLSL